MARGVDWPGANLKLGPPRGMDETQVTSLHVFTNGVTVVSCWELSDEEMAEVIKTGRVFLSIMSGKTMYPAFVGSESEVRAMIADYGAWPKKGKN